MYFWRMALWKRYLLRLNALIILGLWAARGHADEGMWLPHLLKSGPEAEMRRLGMKISAEDIYHANRACLKDAVFLFGGGCTSEIVSRQGLLLTNHHCGFSHLQALSSPEKDYLKYGFVARSAAEELPCKGLSVARVVRLEDVTQEALAGVGVGDSWEQRERKVAENAERLKRNAEQGTHYTAEVLPLFYGNQYLLVVKETFSDVRLVMAPPQCIGEFGGDSDNWMWPRHNGDFMIFRVYAGPDNKPAPYSASNKPYVPLKHLEVSLAGVKEGDFAFVFGFPGFTQQYLPAAAIENIQKSEDAARVAMRTAGLNVLHAAMKRSDTVRIQYAAKEARISNAWKKWQGEIKGLERLQAVAAKQALEMRFRTVVSTRPEFGAALDSLNALYGRLRTPSLARALLVEFLWYGPELPRYAWNFKALVGKDGVHPKEETQKNIEKLNTTIDGFYKNFNPEVEQGLFESVAPVFWRWWPTTFKKLKNPETLAKAYRQSIFMRPDYLKKLLNEFDESKARLIQDDPAFQIAKEMFTLLQEEVNPVYESLTDRVESYMHTYVKGLMTWLPDARRYWPDANGTLRVAYGRVAGYAPRDAVKYDFQTTHTGILEKFIPHDSEFDLLPEVKQLLDARDFGSYALPDGRLPVAFTTNCQTTGGNSGSPVLDAQGRFIGINFDRAWESTMSDIIYHPDLCRNIVCDARYIVWVIEKWAKAPYLTKEMTLIR
ncbi:MAG: S46 family peptidase [Flavobacteriales bacterium]|nr:S46 family peptidase [Flavobacteriales bacterium]